MPGGTKEQVIHVVMETSEAERKAQAFDAAERKRVQGRATVEKNAAKETVETWQQARDRMAAEQTATLNKIVKEANQTNRRLAKEAKDSANFRATADQEAAAKVKAANAEVNQLFASGQRAQIRELQKAIREKARAVADGKRDEKQAMDDAHKLAMMQFQWDKESAAERTRLWKENEQAVLAYGAAFVGAGLSAAVMIAKSLNDYFAQIQRETNEAARDMIAFRDTLKEIATLTGNPGQTTPALMENLEVRGKSFQTGAQANDMMTQMWASAAGSIDSGLITKEEMLKTAGTAGQISKMQGANPAAVGKLWGILPQMTGKAKNTANDIDVLGERLNQEQLLGGFTNFDQAAAQIAKSQPLVTKEIYDAPTQVALLAAFARGGQGDTAAEKLEALTSGLGTGLIRNRGMKVDPKFAEEYQTSSKYLQTLKDSKGVGIGENTRPEEIALSIIKDLSKVLEWDQKQGKYVNIDLELQKRGFSNQETRQAIEKLAGEERQGGMLTNLLNMAHAPLPATAGKTAADFAAHIATDPTGMQAQVDLAKDLAEAKRAMDPSTKLMQMYAASFHQLKGRGEITGDLKDWQNASMAQQIKDDMFLVEREGADGRMHATGWYSQVKQRTQDQLGKQLKAMGIDFQVDEQLLGRGGRQTQFGDANYLLSDEQRARAVAMIQAKGGNPFGSVGEQNTEVISLLRQQLEEQKALREKLNPPAAGAAARAVARPLNLPPPALDGVRQAMGAM